MKSKRSAKKTNPKLVSIGSISSASLLINGFYHQRENLTAVVSTTDTGSSTGIIRKKFSMPAPGDVRAVLAAMGEAKGSQNWLKKLFEYRFKPEHLSELPNTAFGNLFLAALTDMLGSFPAAAEIAGELLGIKGKILPVTAANTHLKAVLADGRELEGEKDIRRVGKPAIEKIFLKDDSATLGEGVAEAVMDADMVLIGPGCLYTSILACLVVPQLPEVLCRTRAKKIVCCNTTTTPGQTDGVTVLDHVKIITHYMNNHPPDYVLINNNRPRPEIEKAYQTDDLHVIMPDSDESKKIKALGCTPILADFLEEDWRGKRTLHKLDTIRHDAAKIKAVLMEIYYKEQEGGEQNEFS